MKGLPRRIVRWYWQLVLLIVVSGWASLTIAQRGDASRGISELLSELRANSWEQRQEGFHKLLETGIGDKFNGRTDRIPSALNKLLLSYPDEADQLKTSLIALLDTENSSVRSQRSEYDRTGTTLSEDFTSYYGDVIAAVTSLNDKRSMPALVDAITTGGMVTRALGRFGAAALPLILEKLKNPDPLARSAATFAIRDMLETAPDVSDAGIRAKIRVALVRCTQDQDPNVRIAAVSAIGSLHDQTARSIVEEIAREDPYKTTQNGVQAFPVRRAAERVLEQWR